MPARRRRAAFAPGCRKVRAPRPACHPPRPWIRSTTSPLLGGYPEPLQAQAKARLAGYTRNVIEQEWPTHRRGQTVGGGLHPLEDLQRVLFAFEPATAGQTVMHAEALRSCDRLVEMRRGRIVFFIAVTDRPFRGGVTVSAEPYEEVLTQVIAPDAARAGKDAPPRPLAGPR